MYAIIVNNKQKGAYIIMHYTQQLKAIRQIKNKQQKEIAEVLGISQQQYSLIETGKRELHIDQLIKLCYYYKISADYILGIKF